MSTVFDDVLAYDPTSANGRVRALLGDTDPSVKVWAEQEVTAALTYLGQNAELAASWLFEGAASDNARLAVLVRTNDVTNDPRQMAELCRQRAKDLRAIAIVAPSVGTNPADPVFVATSGNGTIPGTMDVW